MSNRPILHRVYPQNTKSSYSQYDIVDFVLAAPGRKYVANSFRLEGRIRVNRTGTVQKLLADEILIDQMVGANAIVEDILTSTDNQGSLEVLQNAPRYNKMVYSGLATPDDALDSHNCCELKTTGWVQQNDLLNGVGVDGENIADPNTFAPNGFSIKPVFVLNQVSSAVAGMNPVIRSARTGNVKVSFRLTRNEAVFFGLTATTANATNYVITDMAMTFKSVPDDGNQPPLIMRTKQLVRQTLQSSFSNFTANVNGLVNGVSMTFLKASEENNYNYNNQALEQPPNITQVQYLFNDSNSRFISYNINTQQEMMKYYLDSMLQGGNNSMQLQKIKDNEVYGLGVPFGDLIDLSQNTFGMNLTSDIGTSGATGSWNVYAYFHSVINFQ
jgi:hypothetical protein